MNKLSPRELVLFRRAAEDTIHACNRHYGPFIDVVAHPLNMLKLVEMAELSIQQQSKVNDLQKRMDTAERLLNIYKGCLYDMAADDFQAANSAVALSVLSELEQALEGKAI